MTKDDAIIEMGAWLHSAPGRHLLAWEQDRLDHAVTDAFGFHAVQLGLPELDGLRANRMPHRWVASDSLLLAEPLPEPAPHDDGISTLATDVPMALACDFDSPGEQRAEHRGGRQEPGAHVGQLHGRYAAGVHQRQQAKAGNRQQQLGDAQL